MTNKKIWTLEEALQIFPVVKDISEEFFQIVEEKTEKIKANIMPENAMESLEEEIKKLKYEWANEITRIGADIKGLWLVDFDNGKGYYCWKVGEKELMYEHTYEEGFAGRKPIKREGQSDKY